MSADTLAATGAAVTLAAPAALTDGSGGSTAFVQTGFAVAGGAPGEVVVASIADDQQIVLSAYSLSGALVFQEVVAAATGANVVGSPSLTTDSSGGVAISWRDVGASTDDNAYAGVGADGGFRFQSTGHAGHADPAQLFTTSDGFAMEAWDPGAGASSFQRYTGGGAVKWQDSQSNAFYPYAQVLMGNGGDLIIQDNQARYNGATVTVPGEPAHAMTQVAATALTDGHDAAVAWVDSGTDYVSIFSATSGGFGPTVGLDWGGASDLHLLALADGGFVVSWQNGGAYKGEVFDSAGNGGGVIALAGQVAGFDSHGNLYTVGLDANGQETVQSYAITGADGAANPGAVVNISAHAYAAPAGVTDIHLTGSSQSITGNNSGGVFWSDNTSNFMRGGAGDDVFHMGRGADAAFGEGGNDTFAFAETPWAGDTIGDFSAGDRIDLSALLASASYTGPDPVADGYLKFANDAHGNAQIWADYNQAGNDGWWLVSTVNQAHDVNLQLNDGVITYVAPSGAATTADTNYWAPEAVNSITLTGSQQTVHTGNTLATTVYSDGGGNTLIGGTAHNVFHIGGGGDTVTGGEGRNTFVFDQAPAVAATITNFHVEIGDSIDVSGLLTGDGYSGSDPIGDGYLKVESNNGVDELWANAHQPGNDGWTLVANIEGDAGALTYNNGLLYNAISHPGGTATGHPTFNFGYDTIIVTGAGGGIQADSGGQTLIDQGSNSTLFGGQGNDTLIFGASTKTFAAGGGVDTIVLDAHPTVDAMEQSGDLMFAGDRIDVHNLLDGIGYTGSDPVADHHLYLRTIPTDESHGNPGFNPYQSQLMWDPDGAVGPAGAAPIMTLTNGAAGFHYADGFFTVG